MIGVDTNVLLRALTGDDTGQTPRARRLLAEAAASGDKVYVNHVVLCELAWVLDRTFRLPREQVADILDALLRTARFVVADRDAVEEALTAYKDGPFGFADALVLTLNRDAGCRATYTFDRGAARVAGFAPVPDEA